MQNIRAIQDHFSPIIIGGLNETEILLIIQSNYDDLKLRILGKCFQSNDMVHIIWRTQTENAIKRWAG